MNPFQYVSATSPDEAISLVGQNGRYLGGGIDLIDEMKAYIVSPDILVNVKEIDPFDSPPSGVQRPPPKILPTMQTNGPPGYSLAGNITIAEIAASDAFKKDLPGLVEAAAEVGSPQIRNVATLAGNLLQHSRCWYYRQPDLVCLKRGGTTCYGQDGENKYLSLFSGSACLSPIVSNLSIILSALGGYVTFKENAQSKSARDYSFEEVYRKAWTDPAEHNSLRREDFLLEVHVPLKRTRSAYRQISEKSSFDWALVSCAAAGNVANGKITDARVVLGAVAPVPYMVKEANDFLEGQPLTDATASKAADLILKDAKPLAQNGYKVPLAHTLIRRTLLALNP
jgi:xanthine dehydrogenase YagS FAD-binding subunit